MAISAGAADRLLVLGDSLSAAYGMPVSSGWVSLLQQRLRQQGYEHVVVNASVSGETSTGGRRRLPALLQQHQPRWVLIELGGNDGLRGLPVHELAANLTAMVRAVRAAGAQPVLFQMRLPLNYGARYVQAFEAVYPRVAQQERATLVPFFLAEIATDESAFLPDGIHPTAAVQSKLLNAVWPTLKPLLRPRAPSSRS